jgi:hypothetical protein
MSAFVWLDYSERERQKMLDIVDLFREHDTRDELGIGSVRDAFADLMFPGTNTIMTRARYFLLVPWTYRRLERKFVKSSEIAARARQAEVSLIDPIERSYDNDGNIGKVAKTALKRLPSSVYWQGLSVWGIRSFSGAQIQYHRSLDRYYSQLTQHGKRISERDVEHDDLVSSNWHAGLVAPPEDFPKECSLKLASSEAEYLAERIRLSPGCSHSILAALVAQGQRHESVPFVWEHPHRAKLSAQLRETLDHAQNFSEIMHGASLLYNLMLAEQSHRKDGVARYRRRFEVWAQLISERSHVLSRWDRQRFWEIICSVNPNVTTPSRDFIDHWWDSALSGNVEGLCVSTDARLLIRDRERTLKRNLARLDNPGAQELWSGDSGSSQLDFRWGITQRLLGDIFDGLKEADA